MSEPREFWIYKGLRNCSTLWFVYTEPQPVKIDAPENWEEIHVVEIDALGDAENIGYRKREKEHARDRALIDDLRSDNMTHQRKINQLQQQLEQLSEKLSGNFCGYCWRKDSDGPTVGAWDELIAERDRLRVAIEKIHNESAMDHWKDNDDGTKTSIWPAWARRVAYEALIGTPKQTKLGDTE